MTTIGQLIREKRQKKGLTQGELAKGVVTPSMVSQIESDKASPSYKLLAVFAERLEIPLEVLLGTYYIDKEQKGSFMTAKAMMSSGDFAHAMPILDALKDKKSTKVSQKTVEYEIGNCYLGVGRYEDAYLLFTTLLDKDDVKVDQLLLTKVVSMVAVSAQKMRHYQIAMLYFDRALKEAEALNNLTIRAEILVQVADFYREIGNYADASRLYEESLSVYNTSDDLLSMATQSLNLALAYREQERYDEALEYAHRSYILFESLGQLERSSEVRRHLTMLKRSLVDQDDAASKLLEIAEFFERYRRKEKAGETYIDLATLCFEKGALDDARSFAKKAITLLSIEHQSLGNAHRLLATIYFRLDDQKQARKHLENAINIFDRHYMIPQLEESITLLCKHLEEQGQTTEAYQKLNSLKDRLMNRISEFGLYVVPHARA